MMTFPAMNNAKLKTNIICGLILMAISIDRPLNKVNIPPNIANNVALSGPESNKINIES